METNEETDNKKKTKKHIEHIYIFATRRAKIVVDFDFLFFHFVICLAAYMCINARKG